MWHLIEEYGKWLVGPLGVGTVLKLVWEAIISIPLRRLDQRKMKVMVDLDLQKQAQIDYLTARLNEVLKSAGYPELSSASRDETSTSTTTTTLPPAEPPATGSSSLPKPLQRFIPFGSE